MGTMWDTRYDREDYLFGTAPADFLVSHAELLSQNAGKTALAVADGEGRNSVFMAQQGLRVTAMDNSKVGLEKARALANSTGVSVDFEVADLKTWNWDERTYDLVVAIFIQFADPAFRAQIFDGMKRAVKPGGLILLHGYTPKQIDYGTGGPGVVENLYTEDLLQDAFDDFEIEKLIAYDKEISEGSGHSGLSALIDLVARKPV